MDSEDDVSDESLGVRIGYDDKGNPVVTSYSFVVDKKRPFIFTSRLRGADHVIGVFHGEAHDSGATIEYNVLRRVDWDELIGSFGLSTVVVDEYSEGYCVLSGGRDEELLSFGQAVRDRRVIEDECDLIDGWPHFWSLLKFLLGSKNRERIFIPAYNDLLADHLESKLPKYQTTWARRWIQCCFAVRTAGLVVQCMAVGLRGAIGAVVVPVALREWIRNWWYGD